NQSPLRCREESGSSRFIRALWLTWPAKRVRVNDAVKIGPELLHIDLRKGGGRCHDVPAGGSTSSGRSRVWDEVGYGGAVAGEHELLAVFDRPHDGGHIVAQLALGDVFGHADRLLAGATSRYTGHRLALG